MRSEVSVEAAA
jgi:hypothetical protein